MTRRAQALVEWIALGAVAGAAAGGASAAFLWLLDLVTRVRVGHDVIVYALPAAGIVIGLVYERWGQPIRGGANLVIDTIHDASGKLPLRMAPMVFLGTVVTHLFGGSAGREGTAVQMGASLADELAHRVRAGAERRRQLLAAGVAGGFGSVFGTPIAGMLFGLEVVSIGRIEYDALLPALVAAVVGDLVTRGLGIVHTIYPAAPHVALTPLLVAKWLLFGAAIALVVTVFVEVTQRGRTLLERQIPRRPLRMMLGGAAIVLLWKLVGTGAYLGLGIPEIVRAFSDPTLPAHAFAAKLLFTSLTLATGFLGGEVTPLFFIGAALGGVLGPLLGIPMALGAGVGLAAVFGAAANTPLALSIMAVELLGAELLPHVVIVCAVAYLLTGHRGIYPSQRLLRRKQGGQRLSEPTPLHRFDDRS